MTCRLTAEALKPLCTTNGSHISRGSRKACFIVALSYDKSYDKRIILCEHYFRKNNNQR